MDPHTQNMFKEHSAHSTALPGGREGDDDYGTAVLSTAESVLRGMQAVAQRPTPGALTQSRS